MTAPNAAPPLTAERLDELAGLFKSLSPFFEARRDGGTELAETAHALSVLAYAIRECEFVIANTKIRSDFDEGEVRALRDILSILTGSTR